MTVTEGSDKSANNYYTLMERQEAHVRSSVLESRRRGLDWLFHVDDDELLHFTEPFGRLVQRLPPEVSCVVLVNVEAVPRDLDAECVFTDISVFTQHKASCLPPPHT